MTAVHYITWNFVEHGEYTSDVKSVKGDGQRMWEVINGNAHHVIKSYEDAHCRDKYLLTLSHNPVKRFICKDVEFRIIGTAPKLGMKLIVRFIALLINCRHRIHSTNQKMKAK